MASIEYSVPWLIASAAIKPLRIAGPMFRAPIAVATGATMERDGFVFTDLCLVRDPA